MSEPNLPTRMIRKLTSWTHRFDDTGTKRDRALQLVGVVLGTGALFFLTDWLTNSGLFQQLFYPTRCDTAKPETCPAIAWKDLFQATVLLLGLPVAFMLWHWRDRNVRDGIEEQRKQVENARKDTNLKEFLEVQKMAAGLFDKNLDENGQTDMQVAGLNQLSDFLSDDHPASFRRAAFEILWPSDGASLEKALSFGEWCQQEGDSNQGTHAYRKYVDNLWGELDRVAKARISILHDNWKGYFHSGFPLKGRDFSFLNLPPDADLSGLNLEGCRFIRAGIERVRFENVNLRFSVFDRSFANGASFKNADMLGANIVYAGLSTHNQEGATPHSQPVDFRNAKLKLANLAPASCHGALFHGASLPYLRGGGGLGGAVFDDKTTMANTPPETIWEVLVKLGAEYEEDL